MLTANALCFREVQVSDALWAEPALRAVDSPFCEHNFATVYMWREYYGHRIARVDDRPLVESRFEGLLSFLYPRGVHWKEDVETLADYAHAQGENLTLYGLVKEDCLALEEAFPGCFRILVDPADLDYIYRRTDLAQLSGKAYQKKRNHVSAFSRTYPWTYEPLTDKNLKDACALGEQWYTQAAPIEDSLQAERDALPDLLENRKPLCLEGGLLRVDGVPVALTFASPLGKNAVDVLFEKALISYPGAYAVINQQFAQHTFTDLAYINRENDMGVEGLRQAKLSYHPYMLAEKYTAEEIR